MAPWPCQPCPHCGQSITDPLVEMVPKADRATPDFKAVLSQSPGGAITCPYCQGAVEYAVDGRTLAASKKNAFRFSRAKMEMRANDYGNQKAPPNPAMTPEQWIAEEKLIPAHCRDTFTWRMLRHEANR